MNIKRDPPPSLDAGFPKCRECGLIHPPVPKGQCPIALGEKNKGSSHASLISEITSALNEPKSDKLAEMLQKTVKAWKLLKERGEL